jgi:hypothetical protein
MYLVARRKSFLDNRLNPGFGQRSSGCLSKWLLLTGKQIFSTSQSFSSALHMQRMQQHSDHNGLIDFYHCNSCGENDETAGRGRAGPQGWIMRAEGLARREAPEPPYEFQQKRMRFCFLITLDPTLLWETALLFFDHLVIFTFEI